MSDSLFSSGLVLGDDITLSRELRRGTAWDDWAAQSARYGAVRVRLLDDDVSKVFVQRQDDVVPFRQIRDLSVARLIRVGQASGRVWVAYAEPEVTLFGEVIAPPPKGRGALPARHVRQMVARSTRILDALRPISPAGVLSLDDLALTEDGTVVLLGIGTARLALAARGADAWGASASVAPEVRGDRWAITEASDVYSLGVLGVTLAIGRTPSVSELPAAIEQIRATHDDDLAKVLAWMTEHDPSMRPSLGDEVRASLGALAASGQVGAVLSGQTAAVAAGAPAPAPTESQPAESVPEVGTHANEAVVGERRPEVAKSFSARPVQHTEPLEAVDVVEEVQRRRAAEAPVVPAKPPKPARSPHSVDLSSALGLLPSPTDGDPDTQVRWIYRKDGRDLGPVTATRIREMMTSGEIDEHVEVVDSFENSTNQLVDTPYFTDFVLEYIPQRAQMQLAKQEKREQIVTEVRRTSRTAIVAGVAAALSIVAVLVLTRARPEPLPLPLIYATWQHTIAAPQPEYQTIAADEALLASLFDFSEPAPPVPEEVRPSGRRRAGGAAAGAAGETWRDEVFEEFSVSFDNTAPTRKLSSEEINGTIRSNIGAVRPCFEAEMRSNPGFRGVTVNFSIRPNGSTFNISVEARGGLSTTNERCLISAMRRVSFPPFNDVPMSVSFPFNLN